MNSKEVIISNSEIDEVANALCHFLDVSNFFNKFINI